MFGDNPIRDDERHLSGETLAVQEIFYTIQGEGPQAGRPAVFIRLAGCNLACSFCDTEFESNIHNLLSLDQIIKLVESFPHSGLVVLTGGEPLRQNVVPLCERLMLRNHSVQIETAGTLWIDGLLPLIVDDRYSGVAEPLQLVCSPKTPKISPMVAEWCQHFKYVITAGLVSPDDGLPVGFTQGRALHGSIPIRQEHRVWRAPAGAEIWVSPCDPGGDDARLVHKEQWEANTAQAVHSAMRYGYRLSLQIHKLVGLP